MGTIVDMPKAQMKRYAQKWEGLPLPRLQLRWSPKPVPNNDPARRADVARSKRMRRQMGMTYEPRPAWDCYYELVLASKNLVRDEHYDVGFIIVPISWTRRTGGRTPCEDFPTDDVWRDGAHAFWDSKALGWPPIYVIAPDGTATQKTGYRDEPPEWTHPDEPERAADMKAGLGQ